MPRGRACLRRLAAPVPRLGERAELGKNKAMQGLKYHINFPTLLSTVDNFPAVLGSSRGLFEQAAAMVKAELEDEASLQVIHGDFWCGNIVLPDAPIPDGEQQQVPLLVIDWELAQLGVPALGLGQMIAELYELTLFKGIDAGLWLVQGFAEGYGLPTAARTGAGSEAFAFRTAIQAGTHLVC